jgi:hypothetical protein
LDGKPTKGIMSFIFWDIMLCSLVKTSDISKEHVTAEVSKEPARSRQQGDHIKMGRGMSAHRYMTKVRDLRF